MPEVVMILWLPVAIALMAVTWVLTVGAIGRPVSVEEALTGVESDR